MRTRRLAALLPPALHHRSRGTASATRATDRAAGKSFLPFLFSPTHIPVNWKQLCFHNCTAS